MVLQIRKARTNAGGTLFFCFFCFFQVTTLRDGPSNFVTLSSQAVQRVVKDPAPYGPGPWGGVGGKPWDDGVFTGIKQIILTMREAICSMEIEYDRNGQSVWSVRHGGNGVTATRVKTLRSLAS